MDTDTQEEVVQVESTVQRDADVEATPEVDKEVEQLEAPDRREGKKEGVALRDREPGKSVLPFSRIQKIIKADKVSLVAVTRPLQRTNDCRARV
jgi:DNA polymerase epsilon subunit 4